MAPKNLQVLVVEPDARIRAALTQQLGELRIAVLEAADGVAALKALVEDPTIAVVVTNLYLPAGDEECLTRAIKKLPALHQTRVVVHTVHNSRTAHEWARASGVSAFLVHPTMPERLLYAVGRLLTATKRMQSGFSANGTVLRRASLGHALDEIEGGRLSGTSCVVFNLSWWDNLTPRERNGFRRRSQNAGIALRTDSAMTPHSVEVRSGPAGPLSRR